MSSVRKDGLLGERGDISGKGEETYGKKGKEFRRSHESDLLGLRY